MVVLQLLLMIHSLGILRCHIVILVRYIFWKFGKTTLRQETGWRVNDNVQAKNAKVEVTIISDGWQSISSRPIINVIFDVHGMITLCLVTDFSGQDKTCLHGKGKTWNLLLIKRTKRELSIGESESWISKSCFENNGFFFLFIQVVSEVNRQLKRKHVDGCWYTERLNTKTEGSKRLTYTGLLG